MTHSPLSAAPTAGFQTDVLPLANWLTARGHEATLIPMLGRRFAFTFGASEALRRDVEAYNSGQALIEPDRYDAARIALRQRMDVARGGVR